MVIYNVVCLLGCGVQSIDGGHVTSFLLQRNSIVKAQIEQMGKLLTFNERNSINSESGMQSTA